MKIEIVIGIATIAVLLVMAIVLRKRVRAKRKTVGQLIDPDMQHTLKKLDGEFFHATSLLDKLKNTISHAIEANTPPAKTVELVSDVLKAHSDLAGSLLRPSITQYVIDEIQRQTVVQLSNVEAESLWGDAD